MSADSIDSAETVASPIGGLQSLNGAGGRDSQSPSSTLSRSSGALSAAARGFVNLVEGSTPHLSGDTGDVLRQRLVMAGALFFAGFAAFWLRGLLFEMPAYTFQEAGHSEFVGKEQSVVAWVHVVATILVGAIALWLYRAKDASLTALRLAEYTIFGTVAVFFTLITHMRLEIDPWLSEGAHLPAIATPWMLLIFTYALFIPNSWRRSLRFLLPATALPIALILVQKNICPGFQKCLTQEISGSYVSEQALVLLITFATAVVGVYTINSLRKQAFEAKQLGQYRLKQKIGVGGMGEVYLAEHRMMKRPCAIKVIRPEKAGDPRIMARFEREVRSTAKLSHWNSIDIYDYGRTEDGTFYYVMEYLPGHNTGELVEQGGPIPPQRVIYLMDQVCRALSEAHDIGLVHRDIKPANIFCAYRGGEFDVAKLLDFGLAKPIVDTATDTQDVALTAEGAITGSPMFMSPEQATGETEADARSDIYSLGCVLYYLLTGKTPFAYTQAVKVIIAHASEDAVPPTKHNPDLPIELEEIVLRCLEKDPDDRFQTSEDLRLALRDVRIDDEWTSVLAADWWNCNGCPERKAMAAAAIEAAAV